MVIASKHADKPSYPTSLQENADIFKACYALVFFGVPNLGLRHEQLRTIINGQPNEDLIRSLVVSRDSEPSQYLDRLHKDFQQSFTHRDSPMVLFFETRPTKTVEVRRVSLLLNGFENDLARGGRNQYRLPQDVLRRFVDDE